MAEGLPRQAERDRQETGREEGTMRKKQLLKKIRSEFECRRSGMCCRAPGYVFLTSKDLARLADHFKVAPEAFMEEYGETITGGRVLKKSKDDSCIFLEKDGCSVQPVKPRQCRDFPVKWHDGNAFHYCQGIRALAEIRKGT